MKHLLGTMVSVLPSFKQHECSYLPSGLGMPSTNARQRPEMESVTPPPAATEPLNLQASPPANISAAGSMLMYDPAFDVSYRSVGLQFGPVASLDVGDSDRR